MVKKRLLSGIRPTGSLHIGHYLGVLQNWAKLQNEHECFYFIADWHTLTTKYKDTSELQCNIIEVAKDLISSGIDPNKSTLYVQSAVPEVAELHLLLSMVTHYTRVRRNPTLKEMVQPEKYLQKEWTELEEEFKKEKLSQSFLIYKKMSLAELKIELRIDEKLPLEIESQPDAKEFFVRAAMFKITELQKKNLKLREKEDKILEEELTYGLLGYPVLQTADILSVSGELVPVGKDQIAHLELSREIARRFNHIYKTDLFPEPQALLTETPSVIGIDGRKMSKSLDNDIKLVDDENLTKKKVLQMITDPKKIKKSDLGNPKDCQVAYKHYEIFADKKTLTLVQDECTKAKIGCVDCKTRLAGIINSSLTEVRKKRNILLKDKDILEILDIGNKRARQVVRGTLEKVRDVMKLRTWN